MNNQTTESTVTLEELLESADEALSAQGAFYSTGLRLAVGASRGANRNAANAHRQLQVACEQLRAYAQRDAQVIQMLTDGKYAEALATLSEVPKRPTGEQSG